MTTIKDLDQYLSQGQELLGSPWTSLSYCSSRS